MTAPTITPAQTAADLRAGAGWIRRRGWCPGTFYNPDSGKVCLVGGIAAGICGEARVVLGLSSPERARLNAAEDAVTDWLHRNDLLDPRHADDPPVYGAITWNDVLCESGDRAAAVLEAVADELEQTRGVRHADPR